MASDPISLRSIMGVEGTYGPNWLLRTLLHMEQSGEDILEMFLRVYHGLNDVDTTVSTVSPLSAWGKLRQEFLRMAARCRRNVHGAVAIMDVCRETFCIETDPSSHEDAKRGFKITEELVRAQAARGKNCSRDLEQLAQSITNFRSYIDGAPTSPVHHPSALYQFVLRYSPVAHYVIKLLLSFRRISECVGRCLVKVPLALILLERFWSYSADTSHGSSGHFLAITRKSNDDAVSASLSSSPPVPLLLVDPERIYPDTLKYDMERTAAKVKFFGEAWSKIADEIERWAANLDAISEETNSVFFDEIAGTWDAIMDKRHAGLVKMYTQKPAVVI